MDAKRLVTGTLVGGITMWAVGYLIFGLAMASFYAANAGSATGLARDSQILWAVGLGTFALAALVTFAVGWADAKSAAQGFKIGAIVGFLIWFGVDFAQFGNMNISTINIPLVDPLLELVRTGIGGAVIAAVLGRGAKAAS
jgi:hypothetical protein